MIDRDDLLRRVRRANPAPSEWALPAGLADARPPLGWLIDGGKAMAGTATVAPAARRWRRPALVTGIAFAVTLAAVGATLLLLRGSEEAPPITTATTLGPTTTLAPTTTTPPPTTTAASTTTTAPPASAAVTWTRVADQESFRRSYIMSIAEFDGRLVAGGLVFEDDPAGWNVWASDAAVWISDDASQWRRVEAPEIFGGAGIQEIGQIEAGPDGLVAIGVDAGEGGFPWGAVWTSPDGETWQRTTDPALAIMESVVWSGDRWVAVGWDPLEGARAWVSPNGTDWTAITGRDLHGSAPEVAAKIFDVVATSSGLVAVGAVPDAEHSTVNLDGESSAGAVWVSESGVSWERLVSAPVAEDADLYTVTAAPGGGVIAFGSGGAWRSTDPGDAASWHRVGSSSTMPLPLTQPAWDGDRGIAAGGWWGSAVVWATVDGGESWEATGHSLDAFADGYRFGVQDVILSGGRFIAVGGDTAVNPGSNWHDTPMIGDGALAAVWVGMFGG
ncbi:MAG: hypothetical protein JW785_05290 [Acidimicrobiia bacterium]|nr:hypothetical protein [Acidimicrobiia bacterium]